MPSQHLRQKGKQAEGRTKSWKSVTVLQLQLVWSPVVDAGRMMVHCFNDAGLFADYVMLSQLHLSLRRTLNSPKVR